MAAGKLPKPGSRNGPCAEECAHTDCRLTKRWAQERCLHCGEAIRYETRFYRTEEVFAHAVSWSSLPKQIGRAAAPRCARACGARAGSSCPVPEARAAERQWVA